MALLMPVLAIACNADHAGEARKQTAVAVRIVNPRQRDAPDVVASSGRIGSTNEVVLSFKTGGVVDKVLTNEGDYVQKGTLMAALNTTELTTQLRQVDENIAKLVRDLERISNLVKDTVATVEQLQNTQTSLATAHAQRDGILFNISQAYLFAPDNGFVTVRQVNHGEFKSPGAPCFSIAANHQNKKWLFKTSLSDKDRMKLHLGQNCQIVIDVLPDKTMPGIVTLLSNIPAEETGTYDCYASFDPGESIVYGLTGKLYVSEYEMTQMTTLPVEALFNVNNDVATIFVVSNESTVHKQTVHIVDINAYSVTTQESLDTSLRIVTAGKTKVREGVKIKVVQ